MTAGRRITSLVLAALAFVASSAPSSLAGDLMPEPLVTAFRLHDSHGYSLYVSAFSERGDGKGEVIIAVGRKDAAASYRASGTITATAIRADFGALGKIDVVLNPSGRTKTVHRRCWPPERYEPAIYEGIIRFSGERGYARARQTKAPLVPLPIGSACGSGSGESAGPGLPGARLRGVSYAHGRTLKFQLNKNHRKGQTMFSAEISERRSGVSIYRAIEGFASPSAFVYAPDLQSAIVDPPPPFSGSASLRRGRNSVSPLWIGNLAVDFPGRTVPLAGSGVHVGLVHACFTRSNGPVAESC